MVCACLNPPPCIKGAFFFPSSKVLVSQPYSWKTFPCSKDVSRPSVFPQWRFALKAAKKIKNKIKSRRQTHTPGKNTCDRTLQICIKHAMCFSQWYVPVLIFFVFIFIFIFSPRRSRRGTLGISSPGGPVEEPLKPFCSFFSLRRLSSSVVFQWGSLRQTLDLSKTTNEKVPWRRPSNYITNFIWNGSIQNIVCVKRMHLSCMWTIIEVIDFWANPNYLVRKGTQKKRSTSCCSLACFKVF